MVTPKYAATSHHDPILARAVVVPDWTAVIGTLSAAIKGLVIPKNRSPSTSTSEGEKFQNKK